MWQIFIDVSGQAPKDIYIGVLLVDAQRKGEIISDFYKKFPNLKNYDRKSTSVKSEKLLDIVDYFNSKNLRMVCYHFKDFQWKKHERMINDLFTEINSKHRYKTSFYRFTEKIMGILYFYCMQQIILNRKHHHEIIACVESNIDIWEVFRTIQKLAKHYGYHVQPSANIRRIEHLLKMADFIAGCNRNNDNFKLEHFQKHTMLNDPVKDYDLKKVFNIFSNESRNKK